MARYAPHVALLFTGTFSALMSMAAPAVAQSSPRFDVVTPITQLAPADAYFGRFRMSVLGIRNAIRDVGLRVDAASADDLPALFHKLTMVEDAVLDLKDRYPQDSWLPQLGLSLGQAFARMAFPGAQIHANDALDWVIADYPSTSQAFYAGGMRRQRLLPVATMEVPIEPTLPSYAVPETP